MQHRKTTVLYIDYHELKNSKQQILDIFREQYFITLSDGGGNANNIFIWGGEHVIQQELNLRQEIRESTTTYNNALVYQRLLAVDPSFEQMKYLFCKKKCNFFGFTNLNNDTFIKTLIFLYNCGAQITFSSLLVDRSLNFDSGLISSLFIINDKYINLNIANSNLELKQKISHDANSKEIINFFQNLNVFFNKYKDSLASRTLHWTTDSRVNNLHRFYFVLFQENEFLNLFFRNSINDEYFTRLYYTIDLSHMPPNLFISANKLNNALMMYYYKLNIDFNQYSFTAYCYFQKQYIQCNNLFLLTNFTKTSSFNICDYSTMHNKININNKLSYLNSSLLFTEIFFV